jgi:hypothetical protein
MNDSQRFYRLHIRLEGIDPPIYRRLIVPGIITLDRLNDVIQIAMGWSFSHLYEFGIGQKVYSEEIDEMGIFDVKLYEAGKYRLIDLIKQKGRTFRYTYDLGDNWEHTVTVEESRLEIDDVKYFIHCIDGERACPPEDVGGVFGYHRFLESVSDPFSEEHDEDLEWYGGLYDSEYFDADDVNLMLMTYMMWSRDRLQPWFDYRGF